GAEAIRRFVLEGGAYIGLCGGAGLATASGLGLLGIDRKPLAERVPSLAGRVRLSVDEPSLFDGVKEPEFYLWWPSQFLLADDSIKVLASMDAATDDAFSSDIPVRGMDKSAWAALEESYGINLDPLRMKGDPVVVEGAYGKGAVIASLVHLDTPESNNGARVLRNLWQRFSLERTRPLPGSSGEPAGALFESMRGIFEFGIDNFLWINRGSMIQWRRGVRGLEYFTLYQLARELAVCLGPEELRPLEEMAREFEASAGELLRLEAGAIRRGERITFNEVSKEATGPNMKKLRERLFGGGKSHGGEFKLLLDRMDGLLYECLKDSMKEEPARDARETGFVQIYTGQGKGKTTASVGLALRAKSRGLRVLYAQFMKNAEGGETALLRAQGIEVRRFKEVLSPLFNPDEDIDTISRHAVRALRELEDMMGGYDLVVADEFVTMADRGLISEEAALEFMAARPEGVELVLTGRGASQALRDAADLVSEVQKVKHYVDRDVSARKGIEY
ncbi:MAG: cob(I)yrinic acid a,c-diamide adenosyltransferase, partial [Thermodesulfovibrionales bacterium]|nr:cob(I)yrinic acid a,c-diamide adenosyltransferase [Thermodesulfovibrionales bacterium]